MLSSLEKRNDSRIRYMAKKKGLTARKKRGLWYILDNGCGEPGSVGLTDQEVFNYLWQKYLKQTAETSRATGISR